MPVITAHTGCMGTEENSLESLWEAVRYHCDVAEVDVVVTKDRVAVLHHDKTVYDYSIGEMNFEDLLQLKKVVRLDDFLESARGQIVVNLDIKTADALSPVGELVTQMGMEADVLMTGIDCEKAIFAKHRVQGVRYMLNADAFFAVGSKQGVEDMIHFAIAHGCSGINIHYRTANTDFVRFVQARYMPVCVWTVDTIDDMRNCIRLGVHSITTKRPDLLTQLLGGKNSDFVC